VDNGVGGR